MDTTRAVLAIAFGWIGFSSNLVYAGTITPTLNSAQGIIAEETAQLTPKAMNFELTPPVDATSFVMIPTKKGKDELPDLLPTSHHKPSTPKPESTATFKSDNKDWEKEVMAIIPQAKQLKQMWKLVDGDTDLHFTNLRFDRGNKGVKYTTHYVPMIGDMDNVEMEFMAGEEMEISLESRHIPFAGELEGFKFKSTVGTDNSKILARYTIKFD